MYRLAEVEVAALYPRIREIALNRGYQGCLKITNYCFLKYKSVCSNIFTRTSTVDCWHQLTRHKGMDVPPHRPSYLPPGRSGSSSPVPAYSVSIPESRVSGLFENHKLLFVD
ncbi:hypothetical protein T07_4533, partial [Trichinella nelsoni]